MKLTLKIFLLLGAVTICLSPIDGGKVCLRSMAMADTCMVGGVINTNTTWSTADCDTYVVYGNLLVDQSATLTIMPGVVVAFEQGYRLEIQGVLTARGTASDSIVFTDWGSCQNPGCWNSIKFRNSSVDTACSLSYCRIEYASSGIYCDTASPTISHSLIKECQIGICCNGGSPYISQNTIRENAGGDYYAGIYIKWGSPVTFGNIIERNDCGGILVQPYYQTASISIMADTIRRNSGYGIRLNSGSTGTILGTIRSCDIYQNSNSGIIASMHGGNVRITNNYIHDDTSNYGGGIYFNDGFAVIDSNCITGNWATGPGNVAGGIYFNGVDSAIVQYNDIVGNSNIPQGVFEVYSGTPLSHDIHGEYNWWGTPNADSISYLIYDYYDNFDLHKFIFSPFATSSNCETGSGVSEDENGGKFTFFLSQNFPNPFNPNTSIQLSLLVSEKVSLKIYNLLGQEVKTLIDEEKRAGEYEVIWDGRDNFGNEVASGIYFCQIKVKNFAETKKLVLLK